MALTITKILLACSFVTVVYDECIDTDDTEAIFRFGEALVSLRHDQIVQRTVYHGEKGGEVLVTGTIATAIARAQAAA